MSSVTVGMILGSPAAADGDGRWLVKFQDVRGDAGDGVRAVAERLGFRARAGAVSHPLLYLLVDGRLNEGVGR